MFREVKILERGASGCSRPLTLFLQGLKSICKFGRKWAQIGQDPGYPLLPFKTRWLKVSRTEVKGKEVCRLRVCPWESAEDGEERLGVLWWEGWILDPVAKKGSLREGFWKPAEGEGGRSSREAFPLPGERASARLFLASCWSH